MKRIRFWIPAVAWMIVIFLFSTRESVQVSPEHVVNFVFFKTLHVLEYAILFVLYYRALKNSFSTRTSISVFLAAFLFTILYAITDEVHQTFIPTREGKPRDVIIDAIGASLAWFTIARLLPKAPKKLQEWARFWHVTS